MKFLMIRNILKVFLTHTENLITPSNKHVGQKKMKKNIRTILLNSDLKIFEWFGFFYLTPFDPKWSAINFKVIIRVYYSFNALSWPMYWPRVTWKLGYMLRPSHMDCLNLAKFYRTLNTHADQEKMSWV